MKRILSIVMLVVMSMGFTGCIMKPYKEPKFVEAKSYESMIVVPKEGNATKQSKLKSEEFMQKGLVSTRRHELNQKWVKTGRWHTTGHWEIMEEVIKISRKPVVKEWTNGTGGTNIGDQALEAQTRDDIGFAQGWTVTANVPENLVVKFAFKYSGRDIQNVIDAEIRSRVETIYNNKVRRFSLDELRETVSDTDNRTNEQKIVDDVVTEAKAFFIEQGIAITNLGYKGQRQYINKEIQSAIDSVYSKAKLQEAAKIQRDIDEKNATNVRDIAKKDAMNVREILEKDAENARKILEKDAQAQAKAYKDINAQITPELLRLKEIEMYRDTWDGDLTDTIVNGGGSNTPMIMNLN